MGSLAVGPPKRAMPSKSLGSTNFQSPGEGENGIIAGGFPHAPQLIIHPFDAMALPGLCLDDPLELPEQHLQ